MGGIGLTSAVTRARSAYFSSWAAVGPAIASKWPHLRPSIASITATTTPPGSLPEYASALAAQRAYAADLHDTATTEPTEAMGNVTFVSDAYGGVQKRLGEAEAKRARVEITNLVHTAAAADPVSGPATLAQWAGTTEEGRVSFLHAHPGPLALPPAALSHAVRRLLRLPVAGFASGGCVGKCGYCKAPLDAFADHADVCPGLIHQRELRHHYVNEKAVLAPARQAKLPAKLEPSRLVSGSNSRPADTGIAYGHGFGDDLHVCYDVVGVGSSVESCLSTQEGGSFKAAIGRKLRGARALDGGLVIVPMPFNTQGGFHQNWQETYRQWAARWAVVAGAARGKDDDVDTSSLVRHWMAVASTAVQHAQFRLTARLQEAAQRLGPLGVEPREWRPPTRVEILARPCTAPPGGG
jgi:hypothetical protein